MTTSDEDLIAKVYEAHFVLASGWKLTIRGTRQAENPRARFSQVHWFRGTRVEIGHAPLDLTSPLLPGPRVVGL